MGSNLSNAIQGDIAGLPLVGEALFGPMFGKKFKRMGSHPWAQRLDCKRRCPGRNHVLLSTLKISSGVRKMTCAKRALQASSAYPAKFSIVVIITWNSSCEVNQSVEAPRPTGHMSTCRRSLVHRLSHSQSKEQTLRCSCQVAKKSWAAVELGDAHVISRSSRSYARAPRTSSGSTDTFVGWCVLQLDDGADDVVSQLGSGWQPLPLEDQSDAIASLVGNAWRCLSLDD